MLGLPVIAIDADINQHLGQSLGMDAERASAMPPLGIEIDRIKDYLRGTNPRITDAGSMIKTTPPGKGSRFINFRDDNPIYAHFVRNVGGVRLMAVGPFAEEDMGIKCYHSKTGAVELLLNHLIDGAKEYVIVDMTAGADAFASGLFTRFDITFLVVEPTIKSLTVYEQYKKYARDYDIKIKVIGNKVGDKDDLDFIKENVGDDLVAIFGQSSFVRMSDRGHKVSFENIEPENRKAIEQVVSCIDAQEKDWDKSYRHAIEFHIKNAISWANAEAGKDIAMQVDPDFRISSVI
jgi:CO dehydrogenase maturation factor